MRVGRKVIFERDFDRDHRIVSFEIAPDTTWPRYLEHALDALWYAQKHAERDAGNRPVSLELVATVQHGWPIPLSYTLHMEVIPL